MRYEQNVRIAASPERVWEVLGQLSAWPEWTASMSRVEVLGNGPAGVGTRVRVKQPRLPGVVWRITDWQPGAGFSWVAERSPVPTRADHWIEADGSDAATVRLVFDQTGPLAPVLGLLAGSLTRRYVAMEADGLRQRSEWLDGP